MKEIKMAKYWIRPQPGSPVSGPYTLAEARTRLEGGVIMWPGQQLLQGPSRRNLTPVK
jgi:hypothetical protein